MYPLECDPGNYLDCNVYCHACDEKPCSLGYYCEGIDSRWFTPGTSKCDIEGRVECPAGSYCPSTTTKYTCPAGYYCIKMQTSQHDHPCSLGGYCPAGSGVEQDCGKGSYCPDTKTRTACPAGSYCPGTRETSPTQCTAGKYCQGTGNIGTTGSCAAQYFCPAGSSSATQNPCPAGSYCPAGASSNLLCAKGSYCPSKSSTENDCGSGYYCPTTTSKIICPAGSYCLGSRATDTTLCTPGYYCSGTGNTGTTGKCTAGYYCNAGSSSPTQNECTAGNYCPFGSNSQISCTFGSYCPKRSGIEQDCPTGSYCPTTSSSIQCTKGNYCPNTRNTKETICPAGYYCATDGLSSVTGVCPSGYYCPEGSISGTANKCLETEFCPEGSSVAIACNCNGMGSCELDKNDCNCFEGSSGDNCEYYSCFGIPNHNESSCSVNGYCKTMDNCECNEGYYGNQCESWVCLGVPHNASNVCSGNGFCEKYDSCICKDGFFGDNCEYSYAGSVVAPIVGAVAGGFFLFFVCILLITIPIIICVIKQKKKLKEFDKYEDEIAMIKLDEQETEGTAKFNLSKKFLTIDQSEIKLTKRLGAGAYAETFLCEFAHADACFKSFKLTNFSESSNSDFEKELELLSSISHPNIVSFLGCTLKAPRLGILLEYCPNGDLSDRIDAMKVGKIPTASFSERLEWLLQMSGALSHLHKRGIIHRDLKLENVLLDRNNQVKICDFGLSRAMEKNGKVKTLTSHVGTSIYIAPEVTQGGKYSVSCDVFSFAIIMYQLLTLNLIPYGKSNQNGIEFKVLKDNLRPKIDENDPKYQDKKWFIKLMKQAWSGNPSERPTMDSLRNTLKSHFDEIGNSKRIQPKALEEKKSNDQIDYEQKMKEMELMYKRKMRALEIENNKLKNKKPVVPKRPPSVIKGSVPKRLSTPKRASKGKPSVPKPPSMKQKPIPLSPKKRPPSIKAKPSLPKKRPPSIKGMINLKSKQSIPMKKPKIPQKPKSGRPFVSKKERPSVPKKRPSVPKTKPRKY